MLSEARRLDEEVGVSVRYVVGRAEEIPFAENSFDAVAAGQCWHWFDRSAAAAEVLRVLKPGGRLVIAHFDWIALPGNVAEATEGLIESYNPAWKNNPAWKVSGGTGLYPAWLTDVAVAGFTGIETFSFDVEVPYTHEGWGGGSGRAPASPRACWKVG